MYLDNDKIFILYDKIFMKFFLQICTIFLDPDINQTCTIEHLQLLGNYNFVTKFIFTYKFFKHLEAQNGVKEGGICGK